MFNQPLTSPYSDVSQPASRFHDYNRVCTHSERLYIILTTTYNRRNKRKLFTLVLTILLIYEKNGKSYGRPPPRRKSVPFKSRPIEIWDDPRKTIRIYVTKNCAYLWRRVAAADQLLLLLPSIDKGDFNGRGGGGSIVVYENHSLSRAYSVVKPKNAVRRKPRCCWDIVLNWVDFGNR